VFLAFSFFEEGGGIVLSLCATFAGLIFVGSGLYLAFAVWQEMPSYKRFQYFLKS
jgi:hypothetical protein